MEAQLTQKKYACPYCDASFGTRMELEMHTSKWHRTSAQLPPSHPAPPLAVKPQTTQQEELIVEYSLAESKAGLGELCPVLKDANGEIIDGFHRKGENQNWREETLPWIDTPVKLELARLAVNFNRRRVTPQEISERISYLVKAGLTASEIAKQTGIGESTIYKYTPPELKNKAKAKAGALGAQKSAALRVEQTVKTSDNIQMSSPAADKPNINNLSGNFQASTPKSPAPYKESSPKNDDNTSTKNEELKALQAAANIPEIQIAEITTQDQTAPTVENQTPLCVCPYCGKIIQKCIKNNIDLSQQ